MRKYSDKFLNQNYKLKDAVIGMEFEFYMKDISYYKTLELLNQELKPVKTWGFRSYHSGFKPDDMNFKIEPDLSGGSSMVELITGPMDYYDAKYYLIKIIKFIQTYGYTNEKSSIHFNLSFKDDELNLNNLNLLKLILSVDEDEIYRIYPSRKNNVYAKSIKKIIPFKEYDFFNISIGIVKNNLRLPNDKYYGINFLNMNNDKESQRLEFRYIGGKDYEKNTGNLIYFLDRFIIDVYDSIDSDFTSDDIEKLETYLEENISALKNLSKYDNFLVEFPNIVLQIDQQTVYEIVSAYYNNIYDELYNLINATDNLDNCILNYVTSSQTLEIVDASIITTSTLKNFDLINCTCEGIFEDCFLIGSTLNNSQAIKCKLQNSTATNSKILNCKVEISELNNCYFMNGYLNGEMFGGVYRSGKLGPYATLDSEVKIVTDDNNFFDTKFDSEIKGDKKGSLKGYGK
jgi:hypothetical protein